MPPLAAVPTDELLRPSCHFPGTAASPALLLHCCLGVCQAGVDLPVDVRENSLQQCQWGRIWHDTNVALGRPRCHSGREEMSEAV